MGRVIDHALLAAVVLAPCLFAAYDALTGRDMRTMRRSRTIRQALATIVTGSAISDDSRGRRQRQASAALVSSPEIECGCTRQGGRGPGPVPLPPLPSP